MMMIVAMMVIIVVAVKVIMVVISGTYQLQMPVCSDHNICRFDVADT